MEDPDAKETQLFVDELNTVSEPFLAAAPNREDMRKTLTELWDYEKFGCYSRRGGVYYHYFNSGLQNQYVYFQSKSYTEQGKVFFDPNQLSAEGTTSISGTCWTEDGSIWAYGLSEKGSDWVTVKFRTASRDDLSDVIPGVKHSSLAWAHDNSGLFYCKYPDHKSATEGTSVEKHEFHSLYFHKLGTDSKDDVLVYDRRDQPDYMLGGEVTHDGRYLIIDVSRGCDPYNMLYYYDLAAVDNKITGRIEPIPLFDKLDAKYDFIENDGHHFIFKTNKDAPMFKLVKVDISKPQDKWIEMIPENPRAKLDFILPVAEDKMMVCYLEDVKDQLYVHDFHTGERLYQIPLSIGTISGISGKRDRTELFFGFESHLVPFILYRLDFQTVAGTKNAPNVEEIRRINIRGLDAKDFKEEQVFYESKDGTKVPMFIISRADMQKNGENGVILNGYGGFNIANTPTFSVSRLMFIKHFSSIIAVANIRGGSEYGEKWHEGGMKFNKQNVFDDFIAGAEFLIKHKYTSTSKLAIQGGSNGGLLMGAVSQQRPELFGAVINRVGVLDMLRFHKFTVGFAWCPEFGNPDVKEEFHYIYKYSPLHNIQFPENGQWPSTLLMSADHDDRVVPSHTLKYTAALYEKAKQHPQQRNPLLARIEVKAGHGAGKPTSKLIIEVVDIYSFLQRVLKLIWRP
ncbi:hypothetical protein WR25_22641 isoform B [Diploscapter pachys]|nr:hypothetical protein WR25_22641 isoform B [Diploscapter pachys]